MEKLNNSSKNSRAEVGYNVTCPWVIGFNWCQKWENTSYGRQQQNI